MEDKKYFNALRFYLLATKLKYKIRSGWDREHWNITLERLESIAEHVYGTCILAISMESEFNLGVDLYKVLKMLVIHEIGETRIGNITPFDNVSKEEKLRIEHEAVSEVLGDLASKDELMDLMIEFDAHKTLESKFAYYCDKLEADLQSKVYQDNGYHRSLNDQENNVAFKNEKVLEIMESGASTPFDVWYLYDIDIYKESQEFTTMLKYIKDRDLSKF